MDDTSSPILLFSEGISYCHLIRPLIIGQWLRKLGHPILVAAPQQHCELFRQHGFETIAIRTADPTRIYSRLAQGGTLYTAQELAEYFRDDHVLLNRVKPRLVVADFRFPLQQLATQASIPVVGITSASCHPAFAIHGSTPDCFLPSLIHPRIADIIQASPIGALTRSATLTALSRPYRLASKKVGLPQLRTFFDYASQGDLCLLCDDPIVMPVNKLREQDQYTGSLIWERDEPLPDELASFPTSAGVVYITVGTQESMPISFLGSLVDHLLAKDYVVILSKGKRKFVFPRTHSKLFVYDFINEGELLKRVDLWIYHGSAMSTYNGLFHAVPMISLPVQADQHFHSQALERLKVGRLIRPSELKIANLVDLTSKMIASKEIKLKAKEVAQILGQSQRQDIVIQQVARLIERNSDFD